MKYANAFKIELTVIKYIGKKTEKRARKRVKKKNINECHQFQSKV